MKWDSVVNQFCVFHYNQSWQNLSIDVFNKSMNSFIEYFSNYEHDPESDVPVFRFSAPHSIINLIGSTVVVAFFHTTDAWW